MNYKKLFTPIKIAKIEIKNRIMMAPMGSNFANHDGTVSEKMIVHYAKRAEGEIGLIITEDTTVSKNANYIYNTVGMFNDDFIPGYKKLVDEVHKYGAIVGPQLIHPSFNARESISGQQPVAASPIASKIYKEIPKELNIEEIKKIVEDFGDGAKRVKDTGADLVQIHAAHNHHLLGSFLSALHNKRTDIYGGTLENRLRLVVEVIQNIKQKCGDDFPVILRISGAENEEGGRTIEETQYILPFLENAGVDAFNISFGTSNAFWDGIPPMGAPFAANAHLAEAAKKVVNVPIITVGRITTPLVAEGVLSTNKADMVALGRALLSDHEFALKAKKERSDEIRTCAGCGQCIICDMFDKPIKCMQNADLGREEYIKYDNNSEKKKVLVVGGGPAGMETARVASLKGHDVTLVDRNDRLGGQVIIASVPPMKQELTSVVKYLENEVRKAGVNIILNKNITSAEIKEFKADAVVIATGGESLVIDSIPGIHNENVIDAWDILKGKIAPGRKSLVIGGGLVGCETADFISPIYGDMGIGANQVTIVEMKDNILLDDYSPSRHNLVMSLRRKDVEFITSAKVKEIKNDGIVYEKDNEIFTLKGFDSIVLAMGTKSNNKLYNELEGDIDNIHLIGDAFKARKIMEAVHEGAEVAMKI